MNKIILTIVLLIGIVTCYNASAQEGSAEQNGSSVEVLNEKTAAAVSFYNID